MKKARNIPEYGVGTVANSGGYSTQRINQLRQMGICKPVKIAGRYLYSEQDLEAVQRWRAKQLRRTQR